MLRCAVCGVYELTKKVDLLSRDPIREIAGSAIQGIKQNQAAHARSDAASFEDREGWCKASAVGDDHDRHPGERERSALIAVHSGKLDGRFIKKMLEPVRLPEFASARIGGIDGKLRRHQHGVHARGRHLLRHLLPIDYVLGEIGAVAMKEDDHHRGAFRVETWRNMQKHAVVTKGFRFPKNLAAEIDVARVAFSTNIQERSARRWHYAMIRKRRRLEILKTCQCAEVGGTREGVAATDGAASSSDASRTEGFGLGFGWLAACFAAARPRSALLFCNRLHARAVVLAGISRPRRVRTLAITRSLRGAYVELLNGSRFTIPTSALP